MGYKCCIDNSRSVYNLSNSDMQQLYQEFRKEYFETGDGESLDNGYNGNVFSQDLPTFVWGAIGCDRTFKLPVSIASKISRRQLLWLISDCIFYQ